MSWGSKITVLYLGFVALILSLVFMSVKQKVELVTPDYYKQELNYENRIAALNNYEGLTEKIIVSNENKKVTIRFPQISGTKKFSGEIIFFRPADSAKDITMKLETDEEGKQVIENKKLERGLYKIQISWKQDGKEFYFEDSLFFN